MQKSVKIVEKKANFYEFLPKGEKGKGIQRKTGAWNICSLGKPQAMQAKGRTSSLSSRYWRPSNLTFFPFKKKVKDRGSTPKVAP